MWSKIAYVSKAVAGGLTAGAAALTAALVDGTITSPEWLTIAAALIAGFGVVFGAPANTEPSQDA